MAKKYIEVKYTSRNGHEILKLKPENAVKELKELASKESKFIFLDGKFSAPESLTREALESAQDISLTNALRGG